MESGQTKKHSGDQPAILEITEFDQQDDQDGDLFRDLEREMQVGDSSNQVRKIRRVPEVMKAGNDNSRENRSFMPESIAIGPIHAEPNNLLVSKNLKCVWTRKYLDRTNQNKIEILQKIRNQIKYVTTTSNSELTWFDEECLNKESIMNNRTEYEYGTLGRMLFVDGCAMLQFIYSFVSDGLKDLQINNAQAISVQRDLFLLDNQIPFWVLETIMTGEQQTNAKQFSDSAKLTGIFLRLFRPVLEPLKLKTAAQKLRWKKPKNTQEAVQMFIKVSSMSRAGGPPTELKLEGDHLLAILYQSLLDDRYSTPSDDFYNWACNCLRSFVNVSGSVIFEGSLWVLRFLVCQLAVIIVVVFFYIIYLFIHFLKNSVVSHSKYMTLDYKSLCTIGVRSGSLKSPIGRRSFRNVQELKAAGIELKPSKSRCLKKASFSSGLFGGCLRLCPILVDKSTGGKLLNLIAYEMCQDCHSKTTKDGHYAISSYVSFLDSLIDNEQDVKELRAAHILRHRLSSDAEVADLFNNITPISMADDDAYGKVNAEIQEYYERKIRIWIAEFRHAYLRSPWTLLALIAAALALGLTAVQTYFTIKPR